jgi:hypothetical protein
MDGNLRSKNEDLFWNVRGIRADGRRKQLRELTQNIEWR